MIQISSFVKERLLTSAGLHSNELDFDGADLLITFFDDDVSGERFVDVEDLRIDLALHLEVWDVLALFRSSSASASFQMR